MKAESLMLEKTVIVTQKDGWTNPKLIKKGFDNSKYMIY
jgi:hypothetical protein